MIEVVNLHRIRGAGDAAIPVLRGVDLHVERGEFVAIMGPSGSGKSTLLHLLAGLDTPDAGTVAINGRNLNSASETDRTALRRREIGLVFQNFNLVPALSVTENIALPMVIAGHRRHHYRDRLEALLDDLGLTSRRDVPVNTLSGGEQQRVAIARALIAEPTVLLADEPTGSLDQTTGLEVMAHLQRLHRNQQTILVVTHDPKIASYAQRILLMRDGEIIDEVRIPTVTHATSAMSQLIGLGQEKPPTHTHCQTPK